MAQTAAAPDFSFDDTLERLRAQRAALAAVPSPSPAPAAPQTATAPAPNGPDTSGILKLLDRNSAQFRASTAPLGAAATRIANEPLNIPAPPTMTPMPVKTSAATIVQPMRDMSSMMMFLSLAGGALTGQPLIGAMKAGAAYVHGVTVGDLKAADLAQQDFQDKLKTAIETNTEKLDQYRSVLSSANLSIADKTMRLRGIAMAYGDEQTAALLDQGNIKVAVEAMAAQAKAAEALTLHNDMMNLRIQQSFKPAALSLKDGQIVDGFYSTVAGYQDAQGNKIAASDVSHFYPGVPSEGIITADTAKRAAEMAVDKGDFTDAVRSAGGYGNVGNINRGRIQNAITDYAKSQGKTGADISNLVLQFHSQLAAATTIGHTLGSTAQGTQELSQFAPLVKKLSDKIDRTRFPTINSIELAFQRHVGGQDVVQLHSYIQSIRNAYVMVMSRGGRLTDTQRRYAAELIDGSLSTAQIGAALDALVTEGNVAQSSAQRALQEVTGQKVTAPTAAPSTQYSSPPAAPQSTRSKW